MFKCFWQFRKYMIKADKKYRLRIKHNIRQYVQNLRKYSELQVTNQLAVTVGTFKLSPLSDKQMQLIETHEAFLPRTNNVSDDADRGYGIKFRYTL